MKSGSVICYWHQFISPSVKDNTFISLAFPIGFNMAADALTATSGVSMSEYGKEAHPMFYFIYQKG